MNNQNHHITLILLTKNEAENLQKNFSWLNNCPAINEIVVIDDFSTDKSFQFAKKLVSKNRKVIVKSRDLNHNFSAQRQYAVSLSSNNWVFWLDPDEIPDDKLVDFLNHIDTDKYVSYSFKRLDMFLGSILRHGETNSNAFLRLFHKEHGRFINSVHEVWQTGDQTINRFDLTIHHQPGQTINSFFQKINFYSSIKAEEFYRNKIKFSLFELIFYPPVKFFQNYFLRLGFLDSTPGIILAIGMSFHSFLVRAKLWHLYHS